jgi:regulator of protease activity HflC (stomatin/prohibitin superfamily)
MVVRPESTNSPRREQLRQRDAKTLSMTSSVHKRGHSNAIAERQRRPARPLGWRDKIRFGDAARFSALLAEYIKAPEVTRRRIYIETLQDVMPGIRSKIIVDERTRSILPLLNLDSQKGERP